MRATSSFLVVTVLALASPSARGETNCLECHVPTAGQRIAASPRWNPASAVATSFSTAASSSQLCMSCHDGTTGPQVHLQDSHPVGILYDGLSDSGSRGGLRPSMSSSGLGRSIAEDLLVNGRVECTSCHDEHSDHRAGATMLRMSNEGSRLCLTCHDK